MATKRMFDKAIVDTDKFMDMPLSSKAVYFLLGMEADDEGFVSYKKVMRVHGGNEDDLKVLVAKGFVIVFPSGVVVITDWNKNNWLDTRRIRETEYQNEKKLLTLTPTKEYVLSRCLASIEESSIEEIDAKASISFKDWINTQDITTDYEGDGEVSQLVYRRAGKAVSEKTLRREFEKAHPAPSKTLKKAPRTQDSFDFDTWVDSLSNSSLKVEKIIAFVWKERGYRFENYEQWRARMGQDVKYARSLEGYSPSQVKRVVEELNSEEQKLGYKWSMSTIAKRIANISLT